MVNFYLYFSKLLFNIYDYSNSFCLFLISKNKLLSFGFQIFIFQIIALHYFLVILFCRTVISLIFVFIFLLTIITDLKLRQIKVYLSKHLLKSFDTFTETQFTFVQKNFAVTLLKWLADINRIYGTIICWFIATTLPLNALLVMMLFLSKDLSFKVATICVVIAAFQVFFLFGLSLFAARQAGQFHQTVKGFIGFFIKSTSVMSFNFRLKVAIFIDHFYTTNRYTLNLGKVSKVDFALFGRLLFFYFKFLIFAFKLMTKK